MLLSGCETQPVVVQTETEIVVPPDEWTKPTPVPPLRDNTFEALEESELQLIEALGQCNGDKQSIRAYINKQTIVLEAKRS